MKIQRYINIPIFRESRKRVFLYRWQQVALALLTVFTLLPGNAWSVVVDSSATSSLVGSTENHAQASEEALMIKAQEQGTVRLIVTLDSASQLQGEFAGVQALEAQQAAIAEAQSEVLDGLAVQNVQNVKRFQYTPGMALEVDAAALEILQTNPRVVGIYEDIAVPPALAESVPLINADEVWADGVEGFGQTVAILDTGVDGTHEFLNGKVVSEACYSSNFALQGVSSVCPNGTTRQIGAGAGVPCTFGQCDHGTHVAGIAAGRGSSLNFDGVAREANIIAIQVFSRFPDGPPVVSIRSNTGARTRF